MPYMKQLEEELVEEDVELLQKKARKSEDFSKSLEYFFNSLVPFSWPMSGFSHASYNSSFPIPYSNFLELNSASLHYTYVPYSSCDDLSICVQKGFIIDTAIDNPITLGRRILFCLNNLPICQVRCTNQTTNLVRTNKVLLLHSRDKTTRKVKVLRGLKTPRNSRRNHGTTCVSSSNSNKPTLKERVRLTR